MVCKYRAVYVFWGLSWVLITMALCNSVTGLSLHVVFFRYQVFLRYGALVSFSSEEAQKNIGAAATSYMASVSLGNVSQITVQIDHRFPLDGL